MKKIRQTTIFILLLITILFAMASFCYAETVPNYEDYVECPIYVNNVKIAQPATSINGNIYIDIDTLQLIGSTSTWSFDTKSSYIWVDISNLNLFFGDDETTEFIKNNAGTVQFQLKKFSTTYDTTAKYYVSLGSVAELARLSWEYRNGNVYINQYSQYEGNIALASGKEEVVQSLSSNNTESTECLYKNEVVTIVSETKSFYKIKTSSNEYLYVCKDDIQVLDSIKDIPDYSTDAKTKVEYDGPINIMWSRLKHCPDPINGIDVWVNININQYAENTGACKQTIDYGFIQSAHANEYKVWICAMNGFATTASKYISSNLASEAASNKTIAQYLFYAMVYGADGISLDYESMSYTNGKDKANFEAFVEKLYYYGNKLGLTISVATYYGTAYNNLKMYDYAFLGAHADFLLEMTYGESTTYSLSNMSQKYWKEGTDLIASKTDPKKVIMGVAYHMKYTVWDDQGNLLKSSKPSMEQIYSDIVKYNIPLTWDEYTGQYYAEEAYTSQDGTVTGTGRYYIEDTRSAALKAQYIVDSGLGGTIGWEYSYFDYDEAMKTYAVYNAIYNHHATYNDFVPLTENSNGPIPPSHDEDGKVIINAKTIEGEDVNTEEYHEND